MLHWAIGSPSEVAGLWVLPVVPLAMSLVVESPLLPLPVGHGDIILEVLSNRCLASLVSLTETEELVLLALLVAQPVGLTSL